MSADGQRPHRLLLVSSRLGGGGAERILVTMAEHWVAAGHDVTVATLRRDTTPEYPAPKGVRVERLGLIDEQNPVWRPSNALSLWRLRRAIRRLQPDLVVSYLDKLNIAVVIALRGTGIRVVATEHLAPWMNPMGAVWERLRKLAYRNAAAVVSPTAAITEWFRSRMGGNFVTLASPPRAYPAPAGGRREPLVLAAGRLDPQKGFDVLLDAFGRIADRHPVWRLAIAGEGPARSALEERIRGQQLEERVRLLGQVADIATLYHRADLFVLSSRHEAFPMVLCEAMSAGCCVIATDCPTGPREILGEPPAGRLVPPEDPAALAAALDTLLANATRRDELRSQALARARQISAAEIMKQWDLALASWLERAA